MTKAITYYGDRRMTKADKIEVHCGQLRSCFSYWIVSRFGRDAGLVDPARVSTCLFTMATGEHMVTLFYRAEGCEDVSLAATVKFDMKGIVHAAMFDTSETMWINPEWLENRERDKRLNRLIPDPDSSIFTTSDQ